MNKNAFPVALLIAFILGILTAVVASRTGPNPGGETVISERARQSVLSGMPVVEIPVIFTWPIHAEDYKALSSAFGERDPADVGGYGDFYHNGTDLFGLFHARIVGALYGKVVCHFVPPGGIYEGHEVLGGLVILQHNINGEIWYTRYGHLSETVVHEGDYVVAGEYIGRQGATGQTDSEHLHFEIIRGGVLDTETGTITGGIYYNPLQLMNEPEKIYIELDRQQKTDTKEADMVLKIFNGRKTQEGWLFIDRIRSIHLDQSSWCIVQSNQEDRLVGLVCGLVQVPEKEHKRTGRMTMPNRNSRLSDYQCMFDYRDILQNFERADDFITVKLITVRHEDDDELERFITQHEPHTWLLNDQGKTIERL